MEEQLKNFLKKLKLTESTISTVLGALVVIIVGVLIFNYFKQTAPKEEITPEAAQEEMEEIEFEESETGEKIPQDLPTKHKVSAGENLWKIAEKYYSSGYNWIDIAKENNLVNPDKILVDQELNIPKVVVREPIAKIAEEKGAKVAAAITEEKYKVQKGDSLWSIALRAYSDGYKWPEIAKANNIANPDLILAGQELKLPR